MTGHFVSVFRCPPAAGQTLMVRSGGSVFFASWSPWSGCQHVYGGTELEIEEPHFWWCSTDSVAQSELLHVETAPVPAVTRKGQMLLEIPRANV